MCMFIFVSRGQRLLSSILYYHFLTYLLRLVPLLNWEYVIWQGLAGHVDLKRHLTEFPVPPPKLMLQMCPILSGFYVSSRNLSSSSQVFRTSILQTFLRQKTLLFVRLSPVPRMSCNIVMHIYITLYYYTIFYYNYFSTIYSVSYLSNRVLI